MVSRNVMCIVHGTAQHSTNRFANMIVLCGRVSNSALKFWSNWIRCMHQTDEWLRLKLSLKAIRSRAMMWLCQRNTHRPANILNESKKIVDKCALEREKKNASSRWQCDFISLVLIFIPRRFSLHLHFASIKIKQKQTNKLVPCNCITAVCFIRRIRTIVMSLFPIRRERENGHKIAFVMGANLR